MVIVFYVVKIDFFKIFSYIWIQKVYFLDIFYTLLSPFVI